jgi:hypothetical protein
VVVVHFMRMGEGSLVGREPPYVLDQVVPSAQKLGMEIGPEIVTFGDPTESVQVQLSLETCYFRVCIEKDD